jgi:hypothetical protein
MSEFLDIPDAEESPEVASDNFAMPEPEPEDALA